MRHNLSFKQIYQQSHSNNPPTYFQEINPNYNPQNQLPHQRTINLHQNHPHVLTFQQISKTEGGQFFSNNHRSEMDINHQRGNNSGQTYNNSNSHVVIRTIKTNQFENSPQSYQRSTENISEQRNLANSRQIYEQPKNYQYKPLQFRSKQDNNTGVKNINDKNFNKSFGNSFKESSNISYQINNQPVFSPKVSKSPINIKWNDNQSSQTIKGQDRKINQVLNLKNQLLIKQRQIDTAKKQIARLSLQLISLNKEVGKMKQKQFKSQNQLEQFNSRAYNKNNYEQVVQINQKYLHQIQKIEEQNKAKIQMIKYLQNQCLMHIQSQTKYKKKYKQIQQIYRQIQPKYRQIQQKYRQNQQKYKKIDNQYQQLNHSVQSFAKQCENLHYQIQLLKSQKTDIVGLLRQSQNKLQSNKTQFEKQIKIHIQKLKDSNQKISNLNKVVKTQNQKVQKYHFQNTLYIQENRKIDQKLQENLKSIQQIKKINKTLKTQNQKLNDEVKAVMPRIQTNQLKIDVLQKNKMQMKQKNQTLLKSLAQQRAFKQKYKEELQISSRQIYKYMSQEKQFKKQIEGLKILKQKQHKQLILQQQQIISLNKQTENLNRIIILNQGSLHIKNKQIQQNRTANHVKQQQISQLQEQNKKLKVYISQIQKNKMAQIQKLRNQFKQLQRQFQSQLQNKAQKIIQNKQNLLKQQKAKLLYNHQILLAKVQNQFSSKIIILKDQIQVYKSKLAKKQSQNKNLQRNSQKFVQQIQKLSVRITQLEKQLQLQAQYKESLSIKFKHQASGNITRFNSLQLKIQQLSSKLQKEYLKTKQADKSLQTQRNHFKQLITIANYNIQSQNSVIDNLKSKLYQKQQSIQNILSNHAQSLKQKQDKVKDLSDKIIQLQQQLQSINLELLQNKQQLNKQKDIQKTQRQKYQRKLNQLQMSLEKYKTQKQNLEKQLQKQVIWEDKCKFIYFMFIESKQQMQFLQSDDFKISELQLRKLSEFKQSIIQLKNENKTLKEKTNTQQIYKQIQNNKLIYTQNLTKVQQTAERLTDQNKKLQIQLQQVSVHHEESLTVIQQLRLQLKEKLKQIKTNKEKFDLIQIKSTETKDYVQKLKIQNQQLKDKILNTKQIQEETKNQLSSALDQITQLKSQIKKLQKQNQKLEKKYLEQINSSQKVEEQIKINRDSIQKLQEQNLSLKNDLKDLQEKYRILQVNQKMVKTSFSQNKQILSQYILKISDLQEKMQNINKLNTQMEIITIQNQQLREEIQDLKTILEEKDHYQQLINQMQQEINELKFTLSHLSASGSIISKEPQTIQENILSLSPDNKLTETQNIQQQLDQNIQQQLAQNIQQQLVIHQKQGENGEENKEEYHNENQQENESQDNMVSQNHQSQESDNSLQSQSAQQQQQNDLNESKEVQQQNQRELQIQKMSEQLKIKQAQLIIRQNSVIQQYKTLEILEQQINKKQNKLLLVQEQIKQKQDALTTKQKQLRYRQDTSADKQQSLCQLQNRLKQSQKELTQYQNNLIDKYPLSPSSENSVSKLSEQNTVSIKQKKQSVQTQINTLLTGLQVQNVDKESQTDQQKLKNKQHILIQKREQQVLQRQKLIQLQTLNLIIKKNQLVLYEQSLSKRKEQLIFKQSKLQEQLLQMSIKITQLQQYQCRAESNQENQEDYEPNDSNQQKQTNQQNEQFAPNQQDQQGQQKEQHSQRPVFVQVDKNALLYICQLLNISAVEGQLLGRIITNIQQIRLNQTDQEYKALNSQKAQKLAEDQSPQMQRLSPSLVRQVKQQCFQQTEWYVQQYLQIMELFNVDPSSESHHQTLLYEITSLKQTIDLLLQELKQVQSQCQQLKSKQYLKDQQINAQIVQLKKANLNFNKKNEELVQYVKQLQTQHRINNQNYMLIGISLLNIKKMIIASLKDFKQKNIGNQSNDANEQKWNEKDFKQLLQSVQQNFTKLQMI